jgi:hypothetical protein
LFSGHCTICNNLHLVAQVCTGDREKETVTMLCHCVFFIISKVSKFALSRNALISHDREPCTGQIHRNEFEYGIVVAYSGSNYSQSKLKINV